MPATVLLPARLHACPPPHLTLALALSLGVTRFAYALPLPPMRADLQWSYTLAGAMNTANALGYLLGALARSWIPAFAGMTRYLARVT